MGAPSECYLAQHNVAFVKTPMFFLQSVVDAWQLANILGEADDATVNVFREEATSLLLDLLQGRQDMLGGFVDSCKHHCYGWNELVIGGVQMSKALQTWYEEQ